MYAIRSYYELKIILIYAIISHFKLGFTNMTLENALNSFVQALSKKGKSSNTIVAYRGDINQLITYIQHQQNIADINLVNPGHIESYKKSYNFV